MQSFGQALPCCTALVDRLGRSEHQVPCGLVLETGLGGRLTNDGTRGSSPGGCGRQPCLALHLAPPTAIGLPLIGQLLGRDRRQIAATSRGFLRWSRRRPAPLRYATRKLRGQAGCSRPPPAPQRVATSSPHEALARSRRSANWRSPAGSSRSRASPVCASSTPGRRAAPAHCCCCSDSRSVADQALDGGGRCATRNRFARGATRACRPSRRSSCPCRARHRPPPGARLAAEATRRFGRPPGPSGSAAQVPQRPGMTPPRPRVAGGRTASRVALAPCPCPATRSVMTSSSTRPRSTAGRIDGSYLVAELLSVHRFGLRRSHSRAQRLRSAAPLGSALDRTVDPAVGFAACHAAVRHRPGSSPGRSPRRLALACDAFL